MQVIRRSLKKIGRASPIQRLLGHALALYLRLVRATTRWHREPGDMDEMFTRHGPVIAAMWHGQHFMVPFMRPSHIPVDVLISRHGDGELNAVAVEAFGLRVVRGSGAHGKAGEAVRKGGAGALRALLRSLEQKRSVTLTADVPKVSRVAGEGIVMLARLSGRPVLPVAVVTARRLTFKSWDRASIGLPFGRGAMVVGAPINVPREGTADIMEAKRLEIESALESVHVRACELAGGTPWMARAGEPRHA